MIDDTFLIPQHIKSIIAKASCLDSVFACSRYYNSLSDELASSSFPFILPVILEEGQKSSLPQQTHDPILTSKILTEATIRFLSG